MAADPEAGTGMGTGYGEHLMATGLTLVDPGTSGVRRSAKPCNQLNPPRSAGYQARRYLHLTVTSSREVW
jgi:hypothetical protein